MRKGYKLEHEIAKVLQCADKLGCHCHKNHPCRTVSGIYIEGEPFDYEVFLPDGVDVFDAKEVSGKAWYMRDKDIRQCNELVKCGRSRACRAYFLLLFDGGDVRTVSAEHAAAVLKKGCKTITKGECGGWDLTDRLKELSSQRQTSCQT